MNTEVDNWSVVYIKPCIDDINQSNFIDVYNFDNKIEALDLAVSWIKETINSECDLDPKEIEKLNMSLAAAYDGEDKENFINLFNKYQSYLDWENIFYYKVVKSVSFVKETPVNNLCTSAGIDSVAEVKPFVPLEKFDFTHYYGLRK